MHYVFSAVELKIHCFLLQSSFGRTCNNSIIKPMAFREKEEGPTGNNEKQEKSDYGVK